MGTDAFEWTVNFVKLALIFFMMIQAVPLLVWVERRGSAFIQNRLGPNRVGPLGLMQLLADAVKFIFKEQFVPEKASKFLFNAAPVIALIPAALAWAAIPLASPIQVEKFQAFGKTMGPYVFNMQTVNMNVGVIYILGISSLGAYGVLTAGWGSGSKYSLLGALRASAQMISYELALGLSIIGALMIHRSFNFTDMIVAQQGALTFVFHGTTHVVKFLPNWGIFYQPVAAIIFFAATFAESNRLPFDLAEAEGELVAGFHTEYGGFKMLLFFMGEYGHMIVASSLFLIFYTGGYALPFITEGQLLKAVTETLSSQSWLINHIALGTAASIATALIHLTWFTLKLAFMLWIYIWVRWTLPRFRYDHLMDFGWKTMLPWALANTVITAIVLYFAHLD